MSRRSRNIKKRFSIENQYNNIILEKFINIIMQDGKKSIAEKIVHKAFNHIKIITKEDPLIIFKKSLDKIKPSIEVKPRRIGGATYQIPIEIKTNRSLSLSFRWIKKFSKLRPEHSMHIKLANELIDATKEKGESFKKKKLCIKWQKQTKPLHIIFGNIN